jgi:hypothetical protein
MYSLGLPTPTQSATPSLVGGLIALAVIGSVASQELDRASGEGGGDRS